MADGPRESRVRSVGRPIYVERFVRAPIEALWNATQRPEVHERWDLRFTEIRYLDYFLRSMRPGETHRFLVRRDGRDLELPLAADLPPFREVLWRLALAGTGVLCLAIGWLLADDLPAPDHLAFAHSRHQIFRKTLATRPDLVGRMASMMVPIWDSLDVHEGLRWLDVGLDADYATDNWKVRVLDRGA